MEEERETGEREEEEEGEICGEEEVWPGKGRKTVGGATPVILRMFQMSVFPSGSAGLY